VDGTSGYCTPLYRNPDAGVPQIQVLGSFATSANTIGFSSTHISDGLVITNNSPSSLQFTVSKLDDVEYDASGNATTNAATDGGTAMPLSWLQLGAGAVTAGGPSSVPTQQVSSITFFVDGNGGTAQVAVAHAADLDTNGNVVIPRWNGRLEVSGDGIGSQIINMTYASKPAGQWTGKMYQFANFGDTGLQAWVSNRTSNAALNNVGNAFIQRWGAMKKGAITLDEFKAVVTATVTDSWEWPSVQQICHGGEACYLYTNSQGFGVYSTSLSADPVPTAVSELPVAVNLRADPGGSDPTTLVGKIVTSESLHYAGDPALTLTFDADPSTCNGPSGTDCLATIKSMQAQIMIGGRYVTTYGDTNCAAATGFTQTAVPWLIAPTSATPGFTWGTDVDPNTQLRYRYECRDLSVPYAASTPLPAGEPSAPALNVSLAQANPIPDGLTRVRNLKLVDGALVDQTTLYLIYQEQFAQSFLGATDTAGFSAYGLMVLTRSPADVADTDYQGNMPVANPSAPANVLQTTCTTPLIQEVLGQGATLTPQNAVQLANGVITGISGPLPQLLAAFDPQAQPLTQVASPLVLDTASAEAVHYLCHSNGLFDGGPIIDTSGSRTPCPAGSGVTFFTVTGGLSQSDIAALACQKDGSCQTTLDQWMSNGSYNLRLDPVWRCVDPNQVFCSTNRNDLRAAKAFFEQPTSQQMVLTPLLSAIDDAFRYKTQFENRQGTSLGFAPQICVPDSNAIPYCYDPPAIEQIRDRVDCAIDLCTNHSGDLDAPTKQLLGSFLTTSFSHTQDNTQSPPLTKEGFEWFNAELLITQGDDAYTNAFAARFDLAGSASVSFEGSKFEPNGIDLSGGAGNEMYNLYLATQYYQMVLDRFFDLGPSIWQSISGDGAQSYITLETVTDYFNRLVRASTQKSHAWSEVAKRYQSFNRPDLARHVAQRGYSTAYLESIVLSRMMLRVLAIADPQTRDQIVQLVNSAAQEYTAALLDMREVYATITDEATLFGFAPDFIPFPALDPTDVNAFTKMFGLAQQAVQSAATDETAALGASTTYDTNAALFQAQLVSIKNNYESQLAQICGTFTGNDGNIYPAIRTYAYLNDTAKLMGDPCGFAGNGSLHDAMGQAEIVGVDMQSISQQYDDTIAKVNIERDRVNQQCNLTLQLADYQWTAQGQVNTLQAAIDTDRTIQSGLDKALSVAQSFAELSNCSVGTSDSCPGAVIGTAALAVTAAGVAAAQSVLDVQINGKTGEIADIQQAETQWTTLHQCDVLRADSDATVKGLLLNLKELDLQALKTEYTQSLALASVQGLRNQATSLLAQEQQTVQQAINVAAAQDDPNVRIYKNDAIITADNSFQLALQLAYEATVVFEYYTSQSYAHLADLFLIRLVAHGDYNLQSYLTNLQTAYLDFQQSYGNPDTRVAIVSLRDDVFGIPKVDQNGQAISQSQRLDLFHAKLADASFLDANGYRTMPFPTSIAQLSPLTRDHKVLNLEVEVIGSDVGDTVGRIYVRQRGTGVVTSLTSDPSYYRLPEVTDVLNPFFNGVRAFPESVYQSARMRDRPFVNTHWDLVINQKDESVNQDINLQSLTDVRLYVYYTDFTLSE
jgi:hypothetical protein